MNKLAHYQSLNVVKDDSDELNEKGMRLRIEFTGLQK